jgi:hypothetical protein
MYSGISIMQKLKHKSSTVIAICNFLSLLLNFFARMKAFLKVINCLTYFFKRLYDYLEKCFTIQSVLNMMIT